jgi:hypothetical protein
MEAWNSILSRRPGFGAILPARMTLALGEASPTLKMRATSCAAQLQSIRPDPLTLW